MTTATKGKHVFTLKETKVTGTIVCFYWEGDENSKPFHGTFASKDEAINAMKDHNFEITEDEL